MNQQLDKPRIAIPIPTSSDLEYNRRSWDQYARAVEAAGGIAVEVPLTAGPNAGADCQGVVLPGSPADVDPRLYGQEAEEACAPADAAREYIDRTLLEDAFAHRKPVLAICFGTQFLNVWRGGTLVQDLMVMPVNHTAGRAVAVAHAASVAPASRLGEMLRPAEAPEQAGFLRLPVNSSHHQAIGVPGDGLRVSARSSEDGVIEAVEMDAPDHFVVAVQWHPERTYGQSAASTALFRDLVQQATAWAENAGSVTNV